MIREITVQNFKSLEDLHLPLGRVTVLIGENGAGKSNILEAVAFLGAAAHHKLDAEFLHVRGVRVTPERLPLSAFHQRKTGWLSHSFYMQAIGRHKASKCDVMIVDDRKTGGLFGGWTVSSGPPNPALVPLSIEMSADAYRSLQLIDKRPKELPPKHAPVLRDLFESAQRVVIEIERAKRLFPTPFVIYSPENTALRTFETEGQMRPLGVRGEGLFKLVQRFAEESPERFKALRKELKLFDWFSDFNIPKRLGLGESRLDIKDRFLAAKHLLDQRSANEGFLFVLFYICLFLSPQTPKFFAIDNIDASLNPKLCAELMRRIVALAKQEDKQVIITTHNPAILDGLDLKDKEQMLYAVQRDSKGRTVAKRIEAPKPQRGEPALKLSHAYLRGLIGGLPKNF